MSSSLWPEEEQPSVSDALAQLWGELNDGIDRLELGYTQTLYKRSKPTAKFENSDAAVDQHSLFSAVHALRCQAVSLELAISGAYQEGRVDGCGEALSMQATKLTKGIERLEKIIVP